MSQYNPTDAIFFGFRVIKYDPILVGALAVLITVATVVGMQFAWAAFVDFAAAMQEISTMSGEPDPSEVFGPFGDFFGSPSVWAFFLLNILASLIAQGALLRALIFERRGGWILGMQLGLDELRILVVGILVYLMVLAAYMAGVFVLALVIAILSAAHPALGVLGAIAGIIGLILGVALLGVRFCVAAPASVGEEKFVVLGSWTLTRGRMWGLLGAHVILALIVVVVSLIVYSATAFLAPNATAVMQGMTPVTALDDAAAAFRSPGYVLTVAINAAANVAFMAAWSGVGVYAYRMLGGAMGYANAQPPAAPGGGAPTV